MMDDMQKWVGQPSVYGAFDEDHPPIDERFSDEALDADRGTLAWPMVPVAFFFMPGRFMRSCGVHLSTGVLFLVIWITGISSMLNSLETKSLLGNSFVTVPNDWAALAAMAIGAGLLRGAGIYWLGGLWYRLRLAMCGCRGAEWDKTGRVYMSAGIVKHLFFVVYICYAATQFDTYTAYLQDESGSAGFYYSFLAAVILLQIWSSITLYAGSVATFPLKKIWAVIWLLVLPILLRTGALGLIFLGSYLGNMTPKPKLDQPLKYSANLISFEYPQNWKIEEDPTRPGPKLWVQSSPVVGDAIVEIELAFPEENGDNFDLNEQAWQERLDFELGDVLSDTSMMYGGHECAMRDRIIIFDSGKYMLRSIYWPVGNDGYGMLISSIAPSSEWDSIEPALRHMVGTLRVTDPVEAKPDLQNTYTAKFQEIEFEMPGNWWLNREQNDDETLEDGSYFYGTRFVEAQTPSWGAFQAHLYETSMGARAELAVSIENYSDSGRLENEQSIGEWLGYTGFGVRGQAELSEGRIWNITILVSEQPDGRMLELRRLVPVEFESSYAPGFELIEQSFKLRMPERPEPEQPASP